MMVAHGEPFLNAQVDAYSQDAVGVMQRRNAASTDPDVFRAVHGLHRDVRIR